MIKHSVLAGLVFGALSAKLAGQDLSPIQIDRPDQTECPYIVPENYVQIENGFSFESEHACKTNFSYPSTLWKFGLTDRMELRLITELVSIKVAESKTSGLNPITFGFKVKLREEKGLLPMVSFIGHLTSPDWGSKEFKSTYYAPAFRFTIQHALSENISLGCNLGAEWDGESSEPAFIYTLTSGFSITEKIGCYVEAYGFLPQLSQTDHRLDGGFTYLINNNLIMDLSGGAGLTDNAPDYYAAFGVSYRFNTRNK